MNIKGNLLEMPWQLFLLPLPKFVVFATLFLFSASLPLQVFAEEDDYLKLLEEEASNSAQVRSQVKKPNNTRDKKRQSQLLRFEKLLKFERPSTYQFYRKLSLGAKKKVVSNYYKNKKLPIASKQIFDLYFQQNK